jgi:outer membrane murein-binding lipoprotein Lpp
MAWIVPFIPAIVGAVSSMAGGQAQAQSDDFNSRVAAQNARRAQAQATEDARRQRVASAKSTASLKTGFAGGGLRQEGTVLDAINDSIVQGELLALDIEAKGAVNAQDFRTRSSLSKSAASGAKTQGLLAAGGSLLKQAPAFGKALSTS